MANKKERFDQLYQTHYTKVVRLCLGYVNGNQDEAKDLAQEVFIKVWQHLEGFREESLLGTWVYRISVNTCLVHIRKAKNNKSISFFKDRTIATDSSDSEALEKELQLKKMHACIAILGKKERAIILMTLEGLSQKQIAEVMGMSHETIRVRVHRIKKNLLKCMQR